MKYVVICKAGEQSCANIFSTREEAREHVLGCAEIAGNSFKNLSSTSDDHFTMQVGNNELIEIEIRELTDDEAYYEVEYYKNDELRITKEFSDRRSADYFARDIIKQTGTQLMVDSPMAAQFSGEWIIDKNLINLHVRISVHAIVDGQQYSATDMEYILALLNKNRQDGALGGAEHSLLILFSSFYL